MATKTAARKYTGPSFPPIEDVVIAPPVLPAHNFPQFHDPDRVALVREFVELKLTEKATDKRLKVLREKIDAMIGDAPKGVVGDYVLQYTDVPDTAGTLITQDMVGSVIGVRKGSRQLRIA